DDDVAFVVDRNAIAIQRDLGRALGGGALDRVFAPVGAAEKLVVLEHHDRILVAAGCRRGVDLALVGDDENPLGLGELVDDAVLGVIALGPDIDRRLVHRAGWRRLTGDGYAARGAGGTSSSGNGDKLATIQFWHVFAPIHKRILKHILRNGFAPVK